MHILWKRCTKTKYLWNQKTVTKKNLLIATRRSINVPSNSKHSMILWCSVRHTLSTGFWQKVFKNRNSLCECVMHGMMIPWRDMCMCPYRGQGAGNQPTEVFHWCKWNTEIVLKSDLYLVPVCRYRNWQQFQEIWTELLNQF